MKKLKRILKSVMPHWMFTAAKEMYTKIRIYKWKINGAHLPPPHIVKQMTVREYQNKYHYNVLVETGTYFGEMVEAQKKRFKRIFSIELGVDLYKKAVSRFKNDKNVTILLGDSGKVLTKVLLKIAEPAIFWLDGHYSAGVTAKGEKECPILEELAAIFSGRKLNHILLIDDARCFIGKGDYPTIDQLTNYIKSKNKNYRVEVKYDIVRCVI